MANGTTTDTSTAINALGFVVGVGILLIVGGVGAVLALVPLPEANANNFGIYLGLIGTQLGVIVGYLFGSSIANKKQQDATSKALDLATANTPAPKPDITLPPGGSATVAATPETTT